MDRKNFIKSIAGMTAIGSLSSFQKMTDSLKEQDQVMPALFIGHGSPMNGIENNEFSDYWKTLGKKLPVPQAILIVSAHWLTRGTYITAMEKPKTIHDFGGFPDELFRVQYPAPGNPALAKQASEMITSVKVGLDHEWGLDHGAWSILANMYPQANIPVLQLSIDYDKPAEYHYNLAKELKALRKKGVLIVGSGNMVHNLGLVAWDKLNVPDYGFDWAQEMHQLFKTKIINGDHQALIHYDTLSKSARLAIPTPDHYYPLIYTLGLQDKKEEPVFFNDKLVGGSLNMTSVMFG